MKSLIGIGFIAVAGMLTFGTLTYGADSQKDNPYPPDFKPQIGGEQKEGPADFPKPAFPLIKGELVTVEGEFYTLRDIEGKEIKLHVDKTTKMDCGQDAKGACKFSV